MDMEKKYVVVDEEKKPEIKAFIQEAGGDVEKFRLLFSEQFNFLPFLHTQEEVDSAIVRGDRTEYLPIN